MSKKSELERACEVVERYARSVGDETTIDFRDDGIVSVACNEDGDDLPPKAKGLYAALRKAKGEPR